MRINPAILVLSVIFFVSVSCDKKTDIMHLSCLSRENVYSKSEYFIVSNPHLDMDSLLNLLSEHLRLLVPNDTAEKHIYLNNFYLDLPCEKKKWGYYLGDPCYKPYGNPYLDLLIIIAIQPALNKKEITIYKKYGGDKLQKITLPWN